ncbi:MAG: prephenate dehydrogenase [Candidatus Calescibacterium sp.]|nr:prephenate dehydrogenase [Candidatus Calescibacterium sp.]MDW8086970.1 prephenate dehydrogenase [Candidatus Calescibacterium sp.]
MKVCIIGLGQIGGSLALALRKNKKFVYGISRNKDTIDYAVSKGIISDGSSDINLKNFDKENFDIIFLAVHLGLYEHYIKKLKGFGGILSDVGSVKRVFYRLSKQNGFRFVGCHPIAGTQMSGIESADSNLFLDKYCIISGWSDENSKDVISNLWKEVGAKISFMSPKNHDKFVSAISHLPHIIAFSIVNSTYSIRKNNSGIFGGSFKDIIRVAESPAEMWADIFLYNSDFVVKQTEKQLAEMKKLIHMIKNKQRNKILKYILKTKQKI